MFLSLVVAGQAAADFELVEFSVDAAHANPNDPHEVFFPDFNNFQLTITGTFDVNRCYQVKINRNGGSDCGSANSSGVDMAVVSATELAVDIHPNIDSDFKRANDWEIEVRERAAGCVDGTLAKIHPIALKISGCTGSCLLNGMALTATPSTVSCGGQSRLCAEVPASSGNLVYDWDTNGDGVFDDLTTFEPENCVDVSLTESTQVAVRVTDLGTFEPDCTTTASAFVTVDAGNCDDGNSCTDDSCAPGFGCLNAPATGRECDDNDACTQTDTCQAGVCSGSNPVACTALDQCHDPGTCDPSTGACSDPVKPDDTACDDNDACTQTDTCQAGVCVSGPPLDCDDQNVCTDDSCDPATGCVNMDKPNGTACGDPSDTICDNADTCDGLGGCQGNRIPDGTVCDSDGFSCTDDLCSGGICTHTNVCPGRDNCPFDPTCPEVLFHLAVLEEPSALTCGDGRPDCTEMNPPASCEEVLRCGSAVTVEIWVTKFSPDLDPAPPLNPGIACAYVDLLSLVPVVAEIGFEYGPAFDAGPNFESGTFDGDGGIMDLGACSTAEGGVGVWPEWVLLARVEVEQDHGEDLSFVLQESALFSTSVFGEGAADPVHYGQRCDSRVFCLAHIYDIDDDCFIGPGDLACCAGCWLLCPDDPEYPTGACDEKSCDECNFVKCDPEDCFGPEDFAFWVTCWLKHCDDPGCIVVPDDICGGSLASFGDLPPLPSDSTLRSLGLEPPSADWKGYKRGVLRKWERLEAELTERKPMRRSRPVTDRIEQ